MGSVDSTVQAYFCKQISDLLLFYNKFNEPRELQIFILDFDFVFSRRCKRVSKQFNEPKYI